MPPAAATLELVHRMVRRVPRSFFDVRIDQWLPPSSEEAMDASAPQIHRELPLAAMAVAKNGTAGVVHWPHAGNSKMRRRAMKKTRCFTGTHFTMARKR